MIMMMMVIRRESFLRTCTESASQLKSKVSPSMVNLHMMIKMIIMIMTMMKMMTMMTKIVTMIVTWLCGA